MTGWHCHTTWMSSQGGPQAGWMETPVCLRSPELEAVCQDLLTCRPFHPSPACHSQPPYSLKRLSPCSAG